MNELEEYLSVTLNDPNLYPKGRELRIGDPSTWITRDKRFRMRLGREAEDCLLMHPSSENEDEDEGEVVARRVDDFGYEFTPSFVRECFDAWKASGGAKNPLVDFANDNTRKM